MIEGDELLLADGTRISVATGKKIQQTKTSYSIPNTTEAQRLVTAANRKLSDLPAMPETMNVVAVILSYTLFGVTDDEIAIATNLPLDQIRRIKMMAEYDEMHDTVIKQIMESETTDVRNLFSQFSRKAAYKVADLADSDNEVIALTASKDILDRAGHRPADMIVEQRNKMETDLTIKFVREDKTQSMPVIDLKPINTGGTQ